MNSTWAEHLIKQCSVDKKALEVYKDKIRDRVGQAELFRGVDQPEVSIVSSMISELDYAVSWMQRYMGQQRIPKPTRIDRKLFPSLDIEPEKRLTEERREKMIELLSALSKREQQCLLLHTAYGLSFAAIGKELGVSKTTVQTLIERAKRKIGKF